MKITVKQTTASEIWRILYTVNSIIVTPSILNYYPVLGDALLTEQSIVLPKFDLYKVPTFWRKVSKLRLDAVTDSQIGEELYEYFSQNDMKFIKDRLFSSIEKEKYAAKIKKYLLELQKFLKKNFILPFEKVKEIVVTLTLYGTPSSYHSENGVLRIKYRVDTSLDNIGEVYLLHLLDDDFGRHSFGDEEKFFQSKLWEQEKAVASYLIKRSKCLSENRKEDDPLLFRKQLHEAQVVVKSQKYLAELGLLMHSDFVAKEGEVSFKGNVVRGLTPDAMKVFSYLVQNKGSYCKLSDLNRHLWGEKTGEKFSLHYVPKLVYQMRMAIKSLGIRQELIETKRKMGYTFNEI